MRTTDVVGYVRKRQVVPHTPPPSHEVTNRGSTVGYHPSSYPIDVLQLRYGGRHVLPLSGPPMGDWLRVGEGRSPLVLISNFILFSFLCVLFPRVPRLPRTR